MANIRCSEIMADQLDAFKHDAAWVRQGVLGAKFDRLRSWQAGGSSDQCRYHCCSGMFQQNGTKLAPDVHAALLPCVLQTTLAEEAGQDLATSFGQRAADLMDSCLEGGWQTLCICIAALTCRLQRCPLEECGVGFQLWGAC